ncbi:unnamed protein product [Notodromas monacha]|uniref:FAD dependent oxidoreductase domain-containing protein n=1 Tax=Notodromas monacha TaxID=399045 RepID=A0A7R9GA74_9CRUS|nr:unnamed protein product [Notodromas monacha]CAG0913400.1 unnamed protein product [Notodromas monacha]
MHLRNILLTALQCSGRKVVGQPGGLQMPNVAVIGAGIIGLSTALRVQREVIGANVTIFAEKYLEGTTSIGSGGIFRCGSLAVAPTDELALTAAANALALIHLVLRAPCNKTFEFIYREWLKTSWSYYQDVLHSDEASGAGLTEFPCYMFSDDERFTWNQVLADVIPSYRMLTHHEMELAPINAVGGTFFVTISVETRKFLPWAFQKFTKNGGKFVQRILNNYHELGQNFDVVVNCAGIGAKKLANDRFLEPVRGQVFKVQAPWIKCGYYLGLDTYIIPNVDHVTVGGTRNLGSWSTEVDPHDSESIWKRATDLCPSLKDGTVLEEWVGLRPYRIPVRIEKELVQSDGVTVKVVHNYGHGGYGVTLAPGCARHCVKLIREALEGNMASAPKSKL